MSVTLRQLQTFQAVVAEHSFGRAAEKLNVSQATVTVQIQQLEEAIGMEVFHRENRRRVRLTEAGRLLLGHAERVCTQVDALEQAMYDLKTGEAGHLRIGVIEPLVTQLFPRVLNVFSRVYPNVRVTVETRGTTGIHTIVSNDEVDIGLTTPPPPRSGLQFEPLYTEALVALVPEAHPFNTRECIPVRDLAHTRLILTNPTCAYREVIEQVLIAQGIKPEATLEIGSLLTLKQMVQDGLGIAFLPTMATRTIPKGTQVKLVDQLDLRIPIGVVYKPDTLLLQTSTLGVFIHQLKLALSAMGYGVPEGHPDTLVPGCRSSVG